MSRRTLTLLVAAAVVVGVIYLLSSRSGMVSGQTAAQAQNHADSDELVSGPYEVVKDWPKPLATLFPEEQGWTWGSTQAVYAQNPNRIFIGMRGELPIIVGGAPLNVEVPGIGVNGRSIWLTVPTPGLPARNASVGPTASPGEPHVKFVAQEGRDYRWQHLVYAVDGQGNLVDDWSRWDKTFKRVHKILMSPYDPDKRVWVDDDGRCAIFVFSNDGKQLLQTIGTPNQCGDDATHFNRQTDIAWLPDGTFFVSDGYENTRVVKFDKNGKYITSWGKPSWDWRTRKDVPGLPTPPPPNYFHTVHGIQVDPVTHRVYVSDRENHRIQVFDENGKFLDMWPLGEYAAIYHMLETADRNMWMSDGHGTFKIYKYNLDGKLLYSWGVMGPQPGMLWGVHEISTDQDGNLFTAEVFNGRPQKFRPRPGADPSHLMGQQMRVAWKD
jgi:DNA-binding beta-propeller fold protein YncE